jgi:branched-chain amino acid transport system ATP-binding protein
MAWMRGLPQGLRARGLSRRFGGLTAVENLSLELYAGQAHAVIGPNGAGKSTLINLLSGAISPDEGRIYLDDADITSLPDWRRAQAGIGRSFQRSNLFLGLSVLENARLAAQRKMQGWRLFTGVRGDPNTLTLASAALEQVGLGAFATRQAGVLSHGQRRLLEIALVLATNPGILLLDEPMSGLGPEDTPDVVALLRSLAQGHAMLLVEHDMDVVFAIAQKITVMVDGRVLESGTPASIRASAAVRDAYLGHRE